MTIDSYYPEAVQRPGPAEKTYAHVNSVEGVILHSMVGGLAGAYTVLDDVRVTPVNVYRAGSWHFSIARDGTVYQHYPLTACPFHAGSGYQNRRLIGIEHEGGGPSNRSESLTSDQLEASVRLARWIALQAGFELSRGDGPEGRTRTLLQHREVAATACPSGRFDAIWQRYLEAAPATDELGPNLQLTRYRGFNRETFRHEYELAILQSWGGDTIGPNLEVAYEGYDEGSAIHTFRLGVLRHWA